MAVVTFAIGDKTKSEMSKFDWINWSALARRELESRQKMGKMLLDKLNSKEEQEFIKWSVDLGRRAKKGRFKQLLKEVSPKTREKLLESMPPEKREEYK